MIAVSEVGAGREISYNIWDADGILDLTNHKAGFPIQETKI